MAATKGKSIGEAFSTGGKAGTAASRPAAKAGAATDDKLAQKAAEASKVAGKPEKEKRTSLEVALALNPKFKVPKQLGAVVDALHDARTRKAALNKQVEAVEAEEKALKEHLIEELPKSQAQGIAGSTHRAEIVRKDVWQADSWPLLYAHIVADYQKHAKKKDGQQDGAFALLQRRLGDGAVKELFAAGVAVPGTKKFTAVDVSITKL